jgi:ribosomal protein L17
MIDDLEKNINARISGRAITEPQRQRQLAVEQKPLAEQLQTLGRLATTQQTGVQSARDQLVQLLNLAQQEQQRQEAIAQAPLQYTQSLLPTLSSLLQYQSPEEKLAQQIQAEQSMKQLGLGDYYDKPSTVTPEVVGGQQTGYYQYDPTSQTWKQIISSAPSTSTTDTTGTPVKLTAAQKNTIDSLNKATVIADQIETAVNKLNLANSWLEVPIRYASLSTGALTKSNVDAVAYKSLVTGLLSQLARATGEVGVLTDQDIQRVKSLLPDFNDTKATAKAKLDQLRNFFDALKDSIAGTQTSTTTSGGSTDLGGLNFKLQ